MYINFYNFNTYDHRLTKFIKYYAKQNIKSCESNNKFKLAPIYIHIWANCILAHIDYLSSCIAHTENQNAKSSDCILQD